MSAHFKEIDLSAGWIRYRDEGDGPVLVFIHGLLVNGELWRAVTKELVPAYRCVVPDLPMGSHTIPMKDDADLTPIGIARLIDEFLVRLDLEDVTLVANNTGGAITQLLLSRGCARVARLVLTPCDAFENFLPPMFRPLQLLAKVPPALTAFMQPLRLRPLRRLPFAFGWLSKRPVPRSVSDAWLRPFLHCHKIRRDTARFLAAIDSRLTADAATRLNRFTGPVLIAWAPEDRFFPLDHARRLAGIFPDARLVEVTDSYTFVPEDQPQRLTELIRDFASAGDEERAQQEQQQHSEAPSSLQPPTSDDPA